MAGQPHIAVDELLMSCQFHPHPGHRQAPEHYTQTRQFLSGEDLRQEARDAGVENISESAWYPGLDIYQAVGPNHIAKKPITPCVASDQPISRRETNSKAIEMIMGPFELEGSSEYTVHGYMYELPAQSSQVHSASPKPQASQQEISQCSKLNPSEFHKEFHHLKGLIKSGGAAQSPTTQSLLEEEDITYLRWYIIRGTTTPSSLSPLSYVSTSPSNLAPPTPRVTTHCPHSKIACTAMSVAKPTPHTSAHTSLSTSITTSITSASNPPAFQARYHAYRPQPCKSHFYTTSSNNNNNAAPKVTESPPPLPPKPLAYQPVNYGARIGSMYGLDEEEIYYRRSWGDAFGLNWDRVGDEDKDGDKDEEDGGESRTLRITNQNPPGWSS